MNTKQESLELIIRQFAKPDEEFNETFNRILEGFQFAQDVRRGLVRSVDGILSIDVDPALAKHCKFKCGGRGYHSMILTEDGVVKVKIELCCGRVGGSPYAQLRNLIAELAKRQDTQTQVLLENFDAVFEQNIRLKETFIHVKLRSLLVGGFYWLASKLNRKQMALQGAINIVKLIDDFKAQGLNELQAIEEASRQMSMPSETIAKIWQARKGVESEN